MIKFESDYAKQSVTYSFRYRRETSNDDDEKEIEWTEHKLDNGVDEYQLSRLQQNTEYQIRGQYKVHENMIQSEASDIISFTSSEPPEQLKRYLKMNKMKIPLPAIRNIPTAQPASRAEPPDHLKCYLKMIKMRIPLHSVKNKMKINGVDPKELEDWLNRPKVQPVPATEPPEHLKKYLRLMGMGLPLRSIQNRMNMDGHNPQELLGLCPLHYVPFLSMITDHHCVLCIDWVNPQNERPAAPKVPPLGIEQYLKMYKSGIPMEVIKSRMAHNGDADKMNILAQFLEGRTGIVGFGFGR